MIRRVNAIYSGRVQGVGFRYRVSELAALFNVTGTVRNRPDGAVELVAEGIDSELDAFLDAIRQRMRENIRSESVHRDAANGAFDSFQIVH